MADEKWKMSYQFCDDLERISANVGITSQGYLSMCIAVDLQKQSGMNTHTDEYSL